MRVADGARGLRDERERAAGGERDAGEPGLGDSRSTSRPATNSTAVNVVPCATPNSDMRAMRGCSRLPYARAAADSACASALAIGQLGVEALDRELALEAGDAEDFGARDRPAWPAADRLEQLIAPDALRRGESQRTKIYPSHDR